MIRRLRMKLVGATILSLLVVLCIVLTAANLLNYHELISDADLTLAILAENQGTFPDSYEEWEQRDFLDSPEFSYETRFFYAVLDANGNVTSTFTSQIAAIDDDTASDYAKIVWNKGKESGFYESYRYLVYSSASGNYVFFMDCSRTLTNARRLVFISTWVAAGGLAAVFVLLIFVSNKIVAPFAESYAKQKRFITDAGHELKTPLAVITADTEVLEMDIGENEWLTDIRHQTSHLTELTNDLVVLSRMEERDASAQLERFSLSALAEEVLESFRMMASAQNKSLECSIEPDLHMSGDEKAIRRLISILLDNAMKYSEENGTIRLTLRRQRHQLRLSVYNTKPVIKRENLSHLFDRFYRADESHNSQTGGNGLGLSNAATPVNTQRGKITASTEDEKSLLITAIFPV